MKPITIGQSITERQDTSLGIYLKDVSKQPLIDADEEVELACKIREGDKNALDKLITANLRFVISIAKQYQGKGLSLVDLIQEGAFGVIQAAKTFDETKGFKFISYAVWWIRQSITKAISEQCRTVRVPMNSIVYMSKINKLSEKFEQENERIPSIEELDLIQNKAISALSSSVRSVSLDTPFSNDSGNFLDILPNESINEVDSDLVREASSKVLEEILNNLSYRDRDIVKMSFGIGMEVMQNEEIANRFGISSERVRQIRDASLDYLKNNFKEELKELM